MAEIEQLDWSKKLKRIFFLFLRYDEVSNFDYYVESYEDEEMSATDYYQVRSQLMFIIRY